MFINKWHKYPKRKPKKEGRYFCIVCYDFGDLEYKPTVIDLYWTNIPDVGWVWLDKRRQDIFDGYKVFKPNRAPIEDNRVFKDGLCERIDVIAFRKVPKLPFIFRNSR